MQDRDPRMKPLNKRPEIDKMYGGLPQQTENGQGVPMSLIQKQVGQTPKYLNNQLGSLSYNTNKNSSNALLSSETMGGGGSLMLPGSSGSGMPNSQQNFSPVPQSTKRKPPLPSPFTAKLEGSHSKMALYSQNQIGQPKGLGGIEPPPAYQFQKPSPQQIDDGPSKGLQYSMKNHHQISQGHIPTVNQMQQEEEMRQTWGKIKPKISKQLPPAFAGVGKSTTKSKQ